MQELLGDASKAKNLLGWEPKINLESLISEMIQKDKEISENELLIKKYLKIDGYYNYLTIMPKNKETLINFSDSIFVAGAKGMVGSSITRVLIKKGYGDKSKGGNLLTPSRKELNLCDYSDVQMWFKKNKPSVVIIAAAKVGGILANSNFPTEFLIENLRIQNNIIESSLENNVKRLLFLGAAVFILKMLFSQ